MAEVVNDLSEPKSLRSLPSNSPAGIASPVEKSQRIVSIDVVRGFALLGILMMNIQSFALIDAKYMNPMAQGELSGLSYGLWWFAHVFFDSKFMTIFSLLFGAGIVLMWERAKESGRKTTGLHYRRMFWLLVIGLLHAYLLWHGDILVTYALCGMLVYWFCGLKPRWLFPIGVVLLLIGSGLSVLTGLSLPFMSDADKLEMVTSWNPPAEKVQENLETYRGGWLKQLPHRSTTAFMMETFLFLFLFFWRAGGLMLIGMGLFKLNVFSAQRSGRFYAMGAIVGFAAGLALVIRGVQQNHAHDWTMEYSFFFGIQYNYWGSLFVSFAYICIIMLICQKAIWNWFRESLAAVGQMALTNYLAHTIVCTTIFYGHGLGWFGYMDRLQLVGVVLSIWILQLILSPLWLVRFRFGPFEWMWRSLTYWKLQPLRKVV